MHDGLIVTVRNGEPIAPTVVPDVDAASGDEDADPSSPPLFLPLPPPTLDVDADVATDVPLWIVPVNVGANIAPDQGAADHAVLHDDDDDDEIEGVVHEVPDDKRDANDTTDGKVEGAQPYNLRRHQPPTFELYDNPNGIEDLDLESSVDLESSSFDFSIKIPHHEQPQPACHPPALQPTKQQHQTT